MDSILVVMIFMLGMGHAMPSEVEQLRDPESAVKQTTFTCYKWTSGDLANMNPWSAAKEYNYCEKVLGFKFSHGDDSKAPGCGSCWCCKPNHVKQLPFTCYKFSSGDLKNLSPWSEGKEKWYCEKTLGYTFSRGDASKAPGCGSCWCCKPNQAPQVDNQGTDKGKWYCAVGLIGVTWMLEIKTKDMKKAEEKMQMYLEAGVTPFLIPFWGSEAGKQNTWVMGKARTWSQTEITKVLNLCGTSLEGDSTQEEKLDDDKIIPMINDPMDSMEK